MIDDGGMGSARRDFSNSRYGVLPFREAGILLPFGRRSFLPAIVDRFGGRTIPMGDNTDREAFDLPEHAVTVVYSGMGSPATANALEKAAANGIRRVVLLGACGGVSADVRVGDIVVPTEALRGEGTSRYYRSAEIPALPNGRLCERVAASARERCRSTIHTGAVFTTDASYRQGPEVYENDREVVGVDCECAAAFIVAESLGVQLAAIFFCTDNVRLTDPEDRSRKGLESPAVKAAFEAATDVALEVLGTR